VVDDAAVVAGAGMEDADAFTAAAELLGAAVDVFMAGTDVVDDAAVVAGAGVDDVDAMTAAVELLGAAVDVFMAGPEVVDAAAVVLKIKLPDSHFPHSLHTSEAW